MVYEFDETVYRLSTLRVCAAMRTRNRTTDVWDEFKLQNMTHMIRVHRSGW